MKSQFFTTLILCIAFNSYAQIKFEKGYFIDNNGEKTICLIKNKDWLNNPEQFEYKTDENGPVRLADILSVKEFGVFNVLKYRRFSVKIDKSSSVLSNLSHHKNPEWKEKTLFLKVLTEGEGTLYVHNDVSAKRFFFSVNDSPAEQLVFKRYKTSDNKIGRNEHFKQQLWTRLKCGTLSIENVKRISYGKNDLVKYFMQFNSCKNSAITTYEKDKKVLFNLKIVPGVSYSSFSIYQPGSIYKIEKNIEFNNMISFKPGVEAEFIMPFNKNKWSLFLQPSYHRFKSNEENVTTLNFNVDVVHVEYSAIEVPLGVRHYFFLDDDDKLFVNAAFVIDLVLDSKIDFENRSDIKINKSSTFAFGLGYNKSSYGIELRYVFNRSLVNIEEVLDPWQSNYSSVVLNLTYNIFK